MRLTSLATLTTILLSTTAAYAGPRQRSAPAPRPAVERPAGQTLPLKRVILYSNGVAYFERRGTVTGRAEIQLPFKQSQVDDVLKSMVVLDLGKGRIGSVSYNSSEPPSARLDQIPFSVDAKTDGAGGLAGVLEQFQGARVAVVAGTKSATGAVLTVETRTAQLDAAKPPVTTNTLVIASESGEIVSFDLADVRSVRLLDEGARHDVAEFADATASARRRDSKTIVVTSDGDGPREMIVSYTLAAPIWKTSYRVVLDQEGRPFFQGWAIVDNTSEEDWSDVRLSLVSGTPVSFIHPLQQPLYRYRPVVPIEEDLNLTPQTYEPEESASGTGAGHGWNTGGGSPRIGGGDAADHTENQTLSTTVSEKPLNGLAMNGQRALNMVAVNPGVFNNSGPLIGAAVASGAAGVETAATGDEVGDLFEYNVDRPVTVPRNRSALIPILQTTLVGERVSVYNADVRADRPMGGMRLKNTSALTLEGGPLTAIDGDAYAGEAMLDRLKPGEERFVGFALDLGTLVTPRAEGGREPVFLVRAVDGSFEAHYYQTERKSYTITNQTDRPRIVYVEHPRRDGWTLSDKSPAPVQKTPGYYRFRADVAPKASATIDVVERRELMDSYRISDLTRDEVSLFVSMRYVDDQTRAALERILDLKSRLAAADAKLEALEDESEAISKDQERLRENIKALGDSSQARDLIARYVAKAGQQESRLEQIEAERKAAQADHDRLEADLAAAVRAFSVDRKL